VAANLVLIKSFSVVGVRAGEYLRNHPAQAPGIVDRLARLPGEGAFRPLIGARFALAQAVQAMHALQSRRVAGKIVIEMPALDTHLTSATLPAHTRPPEPGDRR
jgi:NADPH:quinone reductase